jgi:hypothetical protein
VDERESNGKSMKHFLSMVKGEEEEKLGFLSDHHFVEWYENGEKCWREVETAKFSITG